MFVRMGLREGIDGIEIGTKGRELLKRGRKRGEGERGRGREMAQN